MEALRQYKKVVGHYPRHWGLVSLVIGSAVAYAQFGRDTYTIWLAAAGTGLWVLGSLADVVSTYAVIRFLPEYRQRGLPFPNTEINPFLPDLPTTRELVFNIVTIVSILVIPLAALIPGIGVFGGLLRLFAAAFNFRQAQALRSGLKRFDARGYRG